MAANGKSVIGQCFVGAYDAADLAANPGQTVRSLVVRLKRFKGDAADRVDAIVDLRVRFADRDGEWSTSGGCAMRAGALTCGFDGDMSGLRARADRAGLRVEIPNFVAIEIGSADASHHRVVIEGPAHRVFQLAKAKSKQICEPKT